MTALNLFAYIEENRSLLVPPVCNKMIHNDGKLRVMIVGGPNQRKDYHLNRGEELFYQIQGDMCLKVMECGQPKDVVIREGEIFCLPACIPHSPQRFANTVGLVIERQRNEGELDGLRYYVDDTNQQILWQRFFFCTNLGVQLKPLIAEFFASEEFRTRVPSPDMPPSAWEPDTETILPSPFPLAARLAEIKEGHGPLRLFSKEFIVEVIGGETRNPPLPIDTECWVWVIAGTAVVNGVSLGAGDTLLALQKLDDIDVADGGRAMVVYNVGCEDNDD